MVGDGKARPAAEPLADKMLEMLQVGASDALPPWLARQMEGLYGPVRTRVLRVFPGPAARSRALPRYAVFAVDEPSAQEPPHLVSMDAMVTDAIQRARPWSMSASE